MDEQGRPYYYSADGSRSEWELPKVKSLSVLVFIFKSLTLYEILKGVDLNHYEIWNFYNLVFICSTQ